VERVWRWCKRTPWVAGLLFAVSVLLVSIALGSFLAYLRISDEKAATEIERERADRKAQEEEAARKLADKERQVATDQRQLALDALMSLVGDVQNQMRDAPGLQPLRQKLLKTAMEKLQKVVDNADANKDVHAAYVNMAVARINFGELYKELGETEKAFAQYQEANQIFAAIAEKNPDSNAAKGNLAASCTTLGGMAVEMLGDLDKGREYYRRAVDLRKYVVEHPQGEKSADARRNLAEAYSRLADILMDPAKQKDYYTKTLDLSREWLAQQTNKVFANVAISGMYRDLAGACFGLRETAAAKDYYEKCLRLCEESIRLNNFSLFAHFYLGYTQERFGDLYLRTGNASQAKDLYGKAMAKYEQLAKQNPQAQFIKIADARAHYKLATALLRLGEAKTAGAHFRDSLGIYEVEAKASPQNMVLKKSLMVTLARCGNHARATEIAETVRKRSPKDEESLVKVACCYALCASDGTGSPPPDRKTQEQHRAKALDALRQAVTNNYRDVVAIETEPDLDPIREDPRLKTVVVDLTKLTSRAEKR
jgi:tetratricopeptide (TPR) repeat protein